MRVVGRVGAPQVPDPLAEREVLRIDGVLSHPGVPVLRGIARQGVEQQPVAR